MYFRTIDRSNLCTFIVSYTSRNAFGVAVKGQMVAEVSTKYRAEATTRESLAGDRHTEIVITSVRSR